VGECSEGLPGSTKSVGCVERSVRNLGDPGGTWERTRKAEPKRQVGKPKAARESDQPIVLRDGRADHVQAAVC
jgi:hypothetical protein